MKLTAADIEMLSELERFLYDNSQGLSAYDQGAFAAYADQVREILIRAAKRTCQE